MGHIVINVPQRVRKEYRLSRADAQQIMEVLESIESKRNPRSNDEEARDIRDAQRAIVEAKRKGVILWEDLKAELGL